MILPLLLFSCKDNTPEYLTYKKVSVILHVNEVFSLSKQESYKRSFESESCKLDYYVAIFSDSLQKDAPIYLSHDSVVDINMIPGKYKLVGWAEHSAAEESHSRYFHTDDFSEILLRNKYKYEADDSLKIPYHAIYDFSVNNSSVNQTVNMTLTPAMGRYQLIATDTANYSVGKVLVTYTQKFPSALDARFGNITWFWNDISYSTFPVGSKIASDAVFAQNTTETSINLKVEIFDTSGILRARRSSISFTLKNGNNTVVYSNFYSVLDPDEDQSAPDSNQNDKGLIIDTQWDGKHNKHIK